MKLTIDNFDGGGARDYTASIDAEGKPKIQRKLNRPSTMTFALVAGTPEFVVPASGARVVLERGDGQKLFTGYTTQAAEYEYMGWGERGPMYRYSINATSDECVLDRLVLLDRAPFVNRRAGDILKQITQDLAAGAYDMSGVEALDAVPSYSASQRVKWSEHASRLAVRARAAYRVHDGKLYFLPVGKNTYALDESSADFCPDALKLAAPDCLVNDVVVTGATEPGAYVKDYFLGDGYTLTYYMSHTPYLRRRTLLQDEYEGAAVKPQYWSVVDPSRAMSVASGKLKVAGGTGTDGATTIKFVEQLELGGPLMLQHGEVQFSGASQGVIGGVYSDGVDLAHCVAGFRVQPSGGQSTISPIVNGSGAGTSITTQSGHRYALVTRISGTEPFRTTQAFHSSRHQAGNPCGGATVAGDVRLVLELHDIDPNNAGTLVAASTVLYDGVICNAPAYATYALINSTSMQCTLSFTQIIRSPEIDVASTLPGGASQMKLVGSLAEGAHCQYSSSPAVRFFSASVPAPNEAIRVSYRTGAQAMARVNDETSISLRGPRSAVCAVVAPTARTSVECESAALALLEDWTGAAWKGSYRVWSSFLPQRATDIFPGDGITVNVPSRAADFTAIVREVEIDCADLMDDNAQYQVTFANDAAESLSFEFEAAKIGYLPDVTATTATAGSTFIGDVPSAEVAEITSTTLSVNTGAAAPNGGGFEVRRSDSGWGMENDRNLVGRFTTQTFTLPRLSSSQTYYVRQYDGALPARYSRCSTALHIDYPL